jgi:hypothetical protein
MGKAATIRRPRHWTAAVIGLCCAVVLSVAVLAIAGQAGRQLASPSGLRLNLPPEHGPFAQGRPVSIQEAESEAPFHVFRLGGSGGDADLAAVWIEDNPGASGTHVALEYSSGIEVTAQESPFSDPQVAFRQLADELSGAGTVETVNGVPALVIPQGSTKQSPIGSVGLVRQGVYIVVYGHLPVGQLIQIAASLN